MLRHVTIMSLQQLTARHTACSATMVQSCIDQATNACLGRAASVNGFAVCREGEFSCPVSSGAVLLGHMDPLAHITCSREHQQAQQAMQDFAVRRSWLSDIVLCIA